MPKVSVPVIECDETSVRFHNIHFLNLLCLAFAIIGGMTTNEYSD